jgi:hypothetical protein
MKFVLLTLSLGLYSALPAHASIFKDCQDAVERGDAPKALQLAEVISRFNTAPSPSDQLLGAACFTFAMGEQFIYSVAAGAFVPAGKEAAAILKEQEELALQQERSERQAEENRRIVEEQERLSQEMAWAAENEQKARAAREATVIAAAYEACQELFRRDRVASLTNERCIQFFMVTGLPED